ncbi:MAG: YlxR family protein [Bacilli bacterium]|nr:YlxR family protein [Bacilli bacterium]MCI9585402.1 YlxR family protein [Bacilli bacterium]
MNKVRKVPMRMCVVTREKWPKNELIRVVNTANGVIVDPTGKVNGHGAYLKKDLEVFEKAKKSKVLNRVLETTVSDELFDELKQILN